MVCLDTSFVIDLLKGKKEVKEIKDKIDSTDELISIPSPVIMELISGAYLSDKVKLEKEKIVKFLIKTKVIDFDNKSAFLAGEIEAKLIKNGETIETKDIMIASICIENDETLITRNKKHFENIPDLKFEVW